MIKAIFLDMDNTLISHKTHSVPESARKALEELHENGVKIIMATGRDKNDLKLLPVDGIHFDAYITMNGQVCLDEDRKVITTMGLKDESLGEMLAIFNGTDYPALLVENNRKYINYINDFVGETMESIHTPMPVKGEYRGGEVLMGMVFVTEDGDEEVARRLPHCRITRWGDFGVDVIDESSGKAAGMEIILEALNIDRSESMAVGDGGNDMDMIEYAAIGVAMGNSAEALKGVADYVTDDIEEDGLANAFRHFGLID